MRSEEEKKGAPDAVQVVAEENKEEVDALPSDPAEREAHLAAVEASLQD